MTLKTAYHSLVRATALLASLCFAGCAKNSTPLTQTSPMENREKSLNDISFLREPQTFEELIETEEPLFDKRMDFEKMIISDLKKRGVSLDDVLALLEIGVEDGEPVFKNIADINSFMYYGTVEDAAELYTIIDEDGNHRVGNGVNMRFVMEEGITMDDLRWMQTIRDKEGKPILTNAYELIEFQKLGGTEEYARQLAALKDRDGEPLFVGFDLIGFLEIGGTPEYAEALAQIPVKKGGMPFHGGLIQLFKKAGGTVEEAQQLSAITDTAGNPLFDATSMWMFKNGASAFAYSGRPGQDINAYLKTMRNRSRGTVAYAREVAEIKDKDGNPKYDGFGMYRLLQLGLKKKDLVFRDTAKPNAVIAYPTVDFFGAYESAESIAFFHELRRAYDLSVVVASREEQVYQALQDVPNIKLSVLSGHGGEDALSLGTKDPRDPDYAPDELYTIDRTDTELKDHLARLAPEAVIFLYSCLSAEGGETADNLATFISQQAGNHCVFAAQESFPSEGVEVKSLVPFSVKIRDHHGKDITYANEHCAR